MPLEQADNLVEEVSEEEMGGDGMYEEADEGDEGGEEEEEEVEAMELDD